jgi:outer membrane protein assembly factor BamD (BamD/ComL family)
MNLNYKFFSLVACVLFAVTASAEFIRVDGEWKIKAGTTCDVTPESAIPRVMARLNAASKATDAKNFSTALGLWDKVADIQIGKEAEAIALLSRARIHLERGQLEVAEREDLDEFFKRHANYRGFGEAIEMTFDLANRLAAGERPYLGGWFPWFKDSLHALALYEKVVKYAPNGPLADESLIRMARLNHANDRKPEAIDDLTRIISDYPNSKYAAEALETLAHLRSEESLGADWDQATAMESADHWRTLADQFPNDPRAKLAPEQIKMLRDRAARARLNLGKFYWYSRNNPVAAKLMANSCRSISPESEAAKEAEKLLAEIEANPNPPTTIADKLLGAYPRPSSANEAKPAVINDDLDSLGFRKEPIHPATEPERH